MTALLYIGAHMDLYPTMRYSSMYKTFIYVDKHPFDDDQNQNDPGKVEIFMNEFKDHLTKVEMIFTVNEVQKNVHLFKFGETGHIELYYFSGLKDIDMQKSPLLLSLLGEVNALYLHGYKPTFAVGVPVLLPKLQIIYRTTSIGINFKRNPETIIKYVPQVQLYDDGTFSRYALNYWVYIDNEDRDDEGCRVESDEDVSGDEQYFIQACV